MKRLLALAAFWILLSPAFAGTTSGTIAVNDGNGRWDCYRAA